MDIWRIHPSGGDPERMTHHDSDGRTNADVVLIDLPSEPQG
jgi:hypothetical protein